MKKLSELPEDAMLVNSDEGVMTVEELRLRLEQGEDYMKRVKWFEAKERKYRVDAESLVSNHLENDYSDGVPQGTIEQARDALLPLAFEIQKMFDKVLEGKNVTYWEGAEEIELDL